MTKINIYCLFDRKSNFQGVYSSLQAVHRDALSLCNRGNHPVRLRVGSKYLAPTLAVVRNLFKGQTNIVLTYVSDGGSVEVLKTKLIE